MLQVIQRIVHLTLKMNTPATSYPAFLSNAAETDESTPPERPIYTVDF
jgi:hypothetical protein